LAATRRVAIVVRTDGSVAPHPANTYEAKVVSGKKAHDILHWVHRVFSNLKTWAKGVFQGLRKCYLDEFVFHWNQRRHMRSAFDTLLEIGFGLGPETYRDFVDQCA
jgi:hypothetical protein